MSEKSRFLDLIQSNIVKYGYHVTIVNSTIEPRYIYTIGLSNSIGFELIFAGGIYYLKEDALKIIDEIVKVLRVKSNTNSEKINLNSLGKFSLSNVEPSWSKLMMLGVFDYYETDHIKAKQIVPDKSHYTLDIPNLSNIFDASSEPVWQWLVHKWNYSVPEDSTVVSNINALLGDTITEVTRWENDEWEMFAGAGPDVQEDEMRIVSLGTILGIDKTLTPAINLDLGKGLWRESLESSWNKWG
jgi:hypothetical protein